MFNVVKGEMSLVGPRPERPALAERVERRVPGFSQRLQVRPGIAGLAQAQVPHRGTPRRKLRYDLCYIAAMSPWLDLKLCVLCVWRTLRRAGVPGRRTAVRDRSGATPDQPAAGSADARQATAAPPHPARR